ncbi:methylated-DNA--[protein]-cysteine S-methyltransferase [Bailinhaonella thermotolerans]|uniref:Methylated-DNA--protein-cysteine methyltransferase n=1 Tax=Bailinhaonella thermotolerans TaxID=1070861 RepID=A0A3A4B650_9ACTN|nr:methylated-DNA--[protein]-cysteine S-methyltransferase [Bailinhaonella thermotolerans]
MDSPVGTILVALTEHGLAATSFDATPEDRARVLARLRLPEVRDPVRTAEAEAQVAAYFTEPTRFTLPLDWRGASRVQRSVLTTLFETVGFGRTVTYGELAAREGSGVPARAIGSIMGANPIPLVVPCHRVVAGNGLGGFSGGEGVEVKRWLLTYEGAIPATLDWDPAALHP